MPVPRTSWSRRNGDDIDGVPEEALDEYGIDLWAEASDSDATFDFYCDWWRIWVNVKLVPNNDSLHVGGGSALSGTAGAEDFHSGIHRPRPIWN